MVEDVNTPKVGPNTVQTGSTFKDEDVFFCFLCCFLSSLNLTQIHPFGYGSCGYYGHYQLTQVCPEKLSRYAWRWFALISIPTPCESEISVHSSVCVHTYVKLYWGFRNCFSPSTCQSAANVFFYITTQHSHQTGQLPVLRDSQTDTHSPSALSSFCLYLCQPATFSSRLVVELTNYYRTQTPVAPVDRLTHLQGWTRSQIHTHIL